ncbi:hypothetical protein DRQ21_08060 [Candidatus Fermentibacteria bacterium]|nr:MAG: hypothetical protein DRQ21_08060 [Candidatus Fermentibacteria bacterium]
METGNKPVELDKDIVYNNSGKNRAEKKKKLPWIYIAGATGIVLITGLLFVNPADGSFIDSPPPEEQAERDSIFAVAGRIQQYMENYDSLPAQTDIQLPSGITYENEGDMAWTLETESGLFYSSDMDINEFRTGKI